MDRNRPNGFKPGQEILVSVYGGSLLGRVAFTQGPWVNFTVISVVNQTARDMGSYAAGDARTVDYRQVSLSDYEQMKQGRLLIPHTAYRIGQGRQVWTAGQMLQDGRQFIESDPAQAAGQGRWQQPRRKLVTPELAARLTEIPAEPEPEPEQPAEPEQVLAAAAALPTEQVLAIAAALTPDAATEHYANYLRYRAAWQAKQQPFTASQQDTPPQYLFYAQYPQTPAPSTQTTAAPETEEK